MYLQSASKARLYSFKKQIHHSILDFINQGKLGLSILKKMSYNHLIEEVSPSFQTGIPRIQLTDK